MTPLGTLDIGGDPGAWRALGLTLDDDHRIALENGALRIVPGEMGLLGWTLVGVSPDLEAIDGLPTRVASAAPPPAAAHPCGAFEIDHVVVLSGDLERTCEAVAQATGAPLKRIREVGTMRQGFHRLGPGGIIVEVVERPELQGPTAAFWGLVLNVTDLEACVTRLGPERAHPAKDAVQPGRRIATLRRGANLGLPVALMSPPPKRDA